MYYKVKNLKRGQTIVINENTEIYRYFFSECIVEINNGIEEYCILLDYRNKSLIYESLI
tara:strand:+ start:283 stop:459 length:177 start_codon:yes stop_codon:yes gene_type:complete